MDQKNPRLALFGGTFDPVHSGHLEVAQKAKDELALDRVVFVPCQQSPHKKTLPGANGAQRLHMLELATEALPWAEVSDLELRASFPSYTWKTAEAFRRELPEGGVLFLLIGDDQWEALPQWSRPDYLAELVHFIVVGRHGEGQPRPGYQATFIPGHHPASASAIRQQIHDGQDSRWLSGVVENYIRCEGLYRPSSQSLASDHELR